jgi:hypothetical protein
MRIDVRQKSSSALMAGLDTQHCRSDGHQQHAQLLPPPIPPPMMWVPMPAGGRALICS